MNRKTRFTLAVALVLGILGVRYFTETGHHIATFLPFWESNGGTARFGLPRLLRQGAHQRDGHRPAGRSPPFTGDTVERRALNRGQPRECGLQVPQRVRHLQRTHGLGIQPFQHIDR